MTGLSRTVINLEFISINLEFLSFIDLLLNKMRPARGPNKRHNSGRAFVKGSKSRSTHFSMALAPEAAAFNFLSLLSDGSSMCLSTMCLPFNSDLSTSHSHWWSIVSCDIDTPTSLHLIASCPCF